MRDTGGGDGGLTTAERQRLKELERENRELSRIVYGNDIRAGCSEQALWARRPSGTVHHSDKGSQHVSLASHTAA